MTEAFSAVAILGALVVAILLVALWQQRRPRRIRIRARRIPTIGDGAPSKAASTITVAGRTYNIIERGEGAAPRPDPCPWCLRSLDPAGTDAVVCRHPQCCRSAHRRCNKENGGCGGVCGVLG